MGDTEDQLGAGYGRLARALARRVGCPLEDRDRTPSALVLGRQQVRAGTGAAPAAPASPVSLCRCLPRGARPHTRAALRRLQSRAAALDGGAAAGDRVRSGGEAACAQYGVHASPTRALS